MENWNTLEVQTDDYYSTNEYSEQFKDFFSTIEANCAKVHYVEGISETLTTEKADEYGEKYSQLHYDLSTGKIVLDTQEKADKILNELQSFLKENFKA